ncbi:MAG: SDR family oxidoreductase [Coriobacteriia bacterium]
MRVVVFGANGMLGHQLCLRLATSLDVWGTVRGDPLDYARYRLLPQERLLGGIDITDLECVSRVLALSEAEAVVNAIGIIKHRDEAKAAIPSIVTNSLFPHQLADVCEAAGARLVHMSTDCVFSGRRGSYTESDLPDPPDLYGRSKLLGEVDRPGCLTLRTSIIGWEIERRTGLLEWFATQRGKRIGGFRKAIYSGVSTAAIADLIADVLRTRPDLSGVHHVASEPLSKYDLLVRLREKLGWGDIIIEPDDEFACDRSLVGERFEAAAGWRAPSWDDMLGSLAAEWPRYRQWRESTDD